MKSLLEKYKVHLFVFLAIIAISFAYVPDVLEGKVLSQGDITQYKGAASEIKDYHQKTGDRILWTNSQFSGMPTYQISGVAGENPLKYLRIPKRPLTWEKLFLMLFSGYMMFIAFRVRPWLAFIGAVATTFVTGNMTVIEAGHNTQALAIAYLPLIIAGVQYLFRKKWLLGINLVTIGMALQLVMNHVQITYYTGIIIGLWMIYQLYHHIKQKELTHFFKASGLALAGVIVALGANSLNLMLSREYVKDTIRGKSEITINPDGSEKTAPPSEGLDIDYAFQWSNGWEDILSMFIPNYAGGGANTGLYYGGMPFTSGPQYMGIAILFLCVLGFLAMKGYRRWWLLTAILLAIALSLGKNSFVWLNQFFFEYVPFYNIFRAPTMALTIVQICVPLMAILGLNELMKSENTELKIKYLKQTGIGVGAFLIILTFFSGTFNDFRTPRVVDNTTGQVLNDRDQSMFQRYKQQGYNVNEQQFYSQMVDQRKELMKKDAYRSLFFAAAIFIALWFFFKGNLKPNIALLVIGALILIDYWGVDKRYLSSDNFKSKRQIENEITPTQADLAIMQDTSYYRVLDLLQSPMQSARASYFHHSIGGYNAAKLRRYQEFFDWYVSQDIMKNNFLNSSSLNMLNMKYLIYPDKDNNAVYAINQNTYGNAWVVENVQVVDNANAALLEYKNIDPRNTAIIEAKDADAVSKNKYSVDSNARINLASYHPEDLKYNFSSATDAFVVFSEVFYEKGWDAYIDGEKVKYAQVNYILRGLEVPAGKHEIVFKFEPQTYKKGKTISLASNGVIYLLLIASLALGIKNELKSE